MSLNKDVSEAIEKNLPSMVAKELRDYISEMETLRERNASLESQLKSRAEQLVQLNSSLADTTKKLKDLEARELDFDKADERVIDACHKEQVARAQYDTALLVVDKFLRNTIIRENIQEGHTKNTNIPNQYGGYQTVPESQYYNKTRTEEKE